MTRVIVLAVFMLALTASRTHAQMNLLQFGLGAFLPFTVELDGDPSTVEWMAIIQNEWWVVSPNGCKELIVLSPPQVSGNTNVFWMVSLQKISGTDNLVYVDVDASDGYAPIAIYTVPQRCYPVAR